MSDVVIVGGGVSGLSSAYSLARKGCNVTLIEKSHRLGGLLRTDRLLDCRLEAGPDSYISTKPEVTQLARELPLLHDAIIGTNDKARRIFLVHNGRLIPYPSGMIMMVPADVRSTLESDLFSTETKRAILAERFAKPRSRQHDVSVAEFVLDHFDRAILDQVTEPLLTGVYGGDAASLSAQSVLPRFVEYERNHGSLLRAVRQERKAKAATNGSMFLSLRGGMQSLSDALVAAIEDNTKRVHSEAIAVERSEAGWLVRTSDASYRAPHVILCVPTHVTASLLEPSSPELASELAAIPYSSAISVNLLFNRAEVQHPLDGFGFLVPRAERRSVAAATWVNTKFPQRVAEGLVAIRAFIVDRNAEALMHAADSEIVAEVCSELSRLMSINADPVANIVARWPNSMPQYVVGHTARRERIRNLLKETPGLHLAGNAYDGVGIPDCIRSAREATEQVSS